MMNQHQLRLYSPDGAGRLRWLCLLCNRIWPAGTSSKDAEQERCPAKVEQRRCTQ